MPTYSYQCEACNREFETEQRISEAAIRKCPSCGKLKLRRLITSGNFILKGGGWYKDLYSSAPPKSSKKDDSGGDSSKSDSAKSESKGESKKSKADKPAKK